MPRPPSCRESRVFRLESALRNLPAGLLAQKAFVLLVDRSIGRAGTPPYTVWPSASPARTAPMPRIANSPSAHRRQAHFGSQKAKITNSMAGLLSVVRPDDDFGRDNHVRTEANPVGEIEAMARYHAAPGPGSAGDRRRDCVRFRNRIQDVEAKYLCIRLKMDFDPAAKRFRNPTSAPSSIRTVPVPENQFPWPMVAREPSDRWLTSRIENQSCSSAISNRRGGDKQNLDRRGANATQRDRGSATYGRSLA